MTLSHVSFRVEDLEVAITHWTSSGFTLEHRFTKADPEAEVAWLQDGANGRIEIWQYADDDSPKTRRRGRHVAFLCDDARQEAEAFKALGFKEITPYTEGKVVNYLFLEDNFGMAFELTEEKTGD